MRATSRCCARLVRAAMLIALLAAGHTALVVAPAHAVEISAPSLDPAFGTGGRIRYVAGPNPEPQTVALDSAGRMVVAGAFLADNRYKYYIARYTTAGRLDATFGVGGIVTTTNDVSDIAIDTSGRILTVGSSRDGTVLARYDARGRLDRAFSGDGVVNSVGFLLPNDQVLVAANGEITVFGSGYWLGADVIMAMRYSSAGVQDLDFGSGQADTGVAMAALPGQRLSASDAVLDAAGNLIVAGRVNAVKATSSRFALVRFDPEGVVDPTFGTNGFSINWTIGVTVGAASIVLDPNGRLLVGGRAVLANGDEVLVVVRYTAAGAVDPTYGKSGAAIGTAAQGYGQSTVSMEIDSLARVVIVGRSGPNTLFWRVQSNGVADTSLGPDGYFVEQREGNAVASVLDSSGRLVIVSREWAEPSDIAVYSRYLLPAGSAEPFSSNVPAEFVASGITAVDGSVGAELSWTLPQGEAAADVRLAVAPGAAVPAATQTWAAATVTRTGATLSGLRAGTTYTMAVYAVDAAGNLSAPASLRLQGSSGTISLPPTATVGRPIYLRGSLRIASGELGSRSVEVLSRAGGRGPWRVVTRTTTDYYDGNVAVIVRPTENTQYAFRYEGSWRQLGTTVAGGNVSVRSAVSTKLTLVSRAVSPTKVRTGGVVTLAGRVFPSKAGQRVDLQELVGGAWRNVAIATLDRTSSYSFVLPTSTRGVRHYRVHRPADRANLAGYSATSVLTVV